MEQLKEAFNVRKEFLFWVYCFVVFSLALKISSNNFF